MQDARGDQRAARGAQPQEALPEGASDSLLGISPTPPPDPWGLRARALRLHTVGPEGACSTLCMSLTRTVQRRRRRPEDVSLWERKEGITFGLPLYTSPDRSCRGRPPPLGGPRSGLSRGTGLAAAGPGAVSVDGLRRAARPDRPWPPRPRGFPQEANGAAGGSPPARNVTYLHGVRLLKIKTKRTKQNKTQALHRVPGRPPDWLRTGARVRGGSLGAEHAGLGGPRPPLDGPGPTGARVTARLLPARGGVEETAAGARGTAAGLPPARSPIAAAGVSLAAVARPVVSEENFFFHFYFFNMCKDKPGVCSYQTLEN